MKKLIEKKKETYANLYQEIEAIKISETGKNSSQEKTMLVRNRKDRQFYIATRVNLKYVDQKQKQEMLNGVLFPQKIQIIKDLKHPHIIKYYETFFQKQQVIYILEYCQCNFYLKEGDLNFHIKIKKSKKTYFSQKLILNWLLQILMGLSYIHAKNIIHRDIKANNVFLTATGTVKIGHFKHSKVLIIYKSLESSKQNAITLKGSPFYISPQMYENKPYNFKTDIWSLGCLLYQLCALKFKQFDGIDKQDNKLKYSRNSFTLLKNCSNFNKVCQFVKLENVQGKTLRKDQHVIRSFKSHCSLKSCINILPKKEDINKNISTIFQQKNTKFTSESIIKKVTLFLSVRRDKNQFVYKPAQNLPNKKIKQELKQDKKQKKKKQPILPCYPNYEKKNIGIKNNPFHSKPLLSFYKPSSAEKKSSIPQQYEVKKTKVISTDKKKIQESSKDSKHKNSKEKSKKMKIQVQDIKKKRLQQKQLKLMNISNKDKGQKVINQTPPRIPRSIVKDLVKIQQDQNMKNPLQQLDIQLQHSITQGLSGNKNQLKNQNSTVNKNDNIILSQSYNPPNTFKDLQIRQDYDQNQQKDQKIQQIQIIRKQLAEKNIQRLTIKAGDQEMKDVLTLYKNQLNQTMQNFKAGKYLPTLQQIKQVTLQFSTDQFDKYNNQFLMSEQWQ